MIKIKTPQINATESVDGSKATITVEPLEKGLGTTLGNALRRMLLSDLPGVAAVGIKIAGVMHEFATIPNIVEDVVDIILNIKGLAFKANSPLDDGEKIVVTIKTNTPGPVLGKDIDCGMNLSVVNGNHHICTINEGGELDMEITVASGRGYVGADKNKAPEQPIGYIPVDSIFTPVLSASYAVEDARVGQDINYDRLVLDVKTNGTTPAKETLSLAAKILDEHAKLFINLCDTVPDLDILEPDEPDTRTTYLEKTIEDLDLSVRSYNCLKRAGIHTVGDLIERSEAEMLKVRNLGQKSLDEVIRKLAELGLSLRSSDE
ncbi:MAG: DNA-directed RNA polymerase subunit alpha [Clostridia bacterium]|nr:DNA-directed RNA polymerase subunit alpha [Clostridia bacterium]